MNAAIPYYFVCSGCNAKFFAPVSSMRCPRCGTPCAAAERLVPPWEALEALRRDQEQQRRQDCGDS